MKRNEERHHRWESLSFYAYLGDSVAMTAVPTISSAQPMGGRMLRILCGFWWRADV